MPQVRTPQWHRLSLLWVLALIIWGWCAGQWLFFAAALVGLLTEIVIYLIKRDQLRYISAQEVPPRGA